MTSLYFDHNATTFLAPEVASLYFSALNEVSGNASSVHRAGQAAKQHLEAARHSLAASLHAAPQEVVLTSGGTESNNLAILGLVGNLPGPSKHVVTTAIEHPSVLEPCRQLEREGVAVSYVEPDSEGVVSPEAILRTIRPETVLVSVMHANNETGTLQPIAEIAKRTHELGHGIYVHSDGVQAFGKTTADIHQPGVDLYSVSGHKIFAPKGVGALFVRKRTPLKGIQFGGRHERERRAGTENVPGVMALAEAARLCTKAGNEATGTLRDRFEREILTGIDDVTVNGNPRMRLPNTSNIRFRGVSGEALVIALDMKGIAVSSGSACSSGSIEPSHVLLAMGLTAAEARSSVRFSFGRYNTAEEVDVLIDAVISAVRQLRRHTPKERSLVAV